jgi:hypothetical protein
MPNGQINGIKIIKMKSNVPPGAAEDPTAPYNEKTKVIEVDVSQCLSGTVEVVVPEDFDEYEASEDTLKDIVREQIVLPSELILKLSPDCWYVDDFCVCL